MKRIIGLIVFTSMIWGCTFNEPQGPLFEQHSLKTNDKALIYVYRPVGERAGYNRIYYLFDDNGKVTNLEHGGYFPFEVEPGNRSLLAQDDNLTNFLFGGRDPLSSLVGSHNEKAFLKLKIVAGETYFVRFKPIAHRVYFEPTLTLVAKNQGMKEIRVCKLILNKE